MKNSSYKIVVKKEFKDALRDKKSVIFNFLMPIIIMPLMFLIMGFVLGDMLGKANESRICIVQEIAGVDTPLVDESNADFIYLKNTVFKMRKLNGETDTKTTIMLYDNPKQQILDGNIDAIVRVPANFKAQVESGGKGLSVMIISDTFSTNASISHEGIAGLLNAYTQEVYDQRLQQAGVDKDDLIAVDSSVKDMNEYFGIQRQGTKSPFLQMYLPLIITVLLLAGGMSMAVDLIAGEKERNTFEPLLSTGGDRFGIIMAKFTVILGFALANAVMQLIVVSISLVAMPSIAGMGMGDGLSGISIPQVLLAFVNVILLAGLYNSILLVMSATSKNSKEANTKMSPLMIVPMLLAFTGMFIDVSNIQFWTAFVPVLNTINCLKMALAGSVQAVYMTLSIVMNALYLGAAIWWSIKMFSKEKLIARF